MTEQVFMKTLSSVHNSVGHRPVSHVVTLVKSITLSAPYSQCSLSRKQLQPSQGNQRFIATKRNRNEIITHVITENSLSGDVSRLNTLHLTRRLTRSTNIATGSANTRQTWYGTNIGAQRCKITARLLRLSVSLTTEHVQYLQLVQFRAMKLVFTIRDLFYQRTEGFWVSKGKFKTLVNNFCN